MPFWFGRQKIPVVIDIDQIKTPDHTPWTSVMTHVYKSFNAFENTWISQLLQYLGASLFNRKKKKKKLMDYISICSSFLKCKKNNPFKKKKIWQCKVCCLQQCGIKKGLKFWVCSVTMKCYQFGFEILNMTSQFFCHWVQCGSKLVGSLEDLLIMFV